jgi:hypothetical protein
MRGLDNVAHEWALVCLAHNLLKLAQGRSLSAADPATARSPPNRTSRPNPRPNPPIPSRSSTIWTGY